MSITVAVMVNMILIVPYCVQYSKLYHKDAYSISLLALPIAMYVTSVHMSWIKFFVLLNSNRKGTGDVI